MLQKSLIVLFRYFLILPNRNETKRNYRNTEIYRNSSVSVVHWLLFAYYTYPKGAKSETRDEWMNDRRIKGRVGGKCEEIETFHYFSCQILFIFDRYV